MSRSNWIELCELAERHCPGVLLDIPSMSDADIRGVLTWLRNQERERSNG